MSTLPLVASTPPLPPLSPRPHLIKPVARHALLMLTRQASPEPAPAALAVSAWNGLRRHYRRRQLAFLAQYSRSGHPGSNTATAATPRSSLRSAELRRAAQLVARRHVADLDLDTSDTRVRTRSRGTSPAPMPLPTSLPAPAHAPVRRRRQSPVRPTTPIDYTQTPDYAPPQSSLPLAKCLRAEWKGLPMDLSGDPLVGMLHPAEVQLALTLRLPAALYLDLKRRLFAEKVVRLRRGLAFRRTDAQKACRIDVNKALRLFAAYERVGWLDDELFAKFL